MPVADLEGRTVIIATPYKRMAELDLEFALKGLGADVKYESLPVHPGTLEACNLDRYIVNIPTTAADVNHYNSAMQQKRESIEDTVEKSEPKIDAVILHQLDITKQGAIKMAIDLAKRVKKKCPVIICDYCRKMTAIQPIYEAGAKFFDFDELNFEPLATAIAGIVTHHDEPARKSSKDEFSQ